MGETALEGVPAAPLAERRRYVECVEESTATVSWMRRPEGVTVSSRTELDALFDDVEAAVTSEGPLSLHIVRAGGDCLTVGIGEAGGALSFTPDSGEPPYFVSVGDEIPGQEITFYDGHEGPYFDSRNLVSVQDARLVALEFLEGGELSGAIRWEEV